MKVAAKIEKKYIQRDGKEILSLHVHPLTDLNIKVGQFIAISPTDMESVILLEAAASPEPYYNK